MASATSEEGHHSIERLALGRHGSLGDLYDARKECFTGASIFSGSRIPPGVSQSTDNPHYGYQSFAMNTYSDLFKGLGFNGHLKASFLAGMVGLGGSASYVKDLKSSAHTVKAALKFEVETRYESLVMDRLLLGCCLHKEAVKEATHFVVGVQWGGSAYASVESESSVGVNAKGIEARVSARLSELGAALVQLCAAGVPVFGGLTTKLGGERGRLAVDEEERFKFRLDADVLPDSTENMILPNSFEEAWDLLSRIPAQLAQNTSQGRVRPLRFTLYPLSQLGKFVAPRYRSHISMAPRCTSFTSPAIEDLERLFDELQSTKQDLHDLFEDVSVKHSAAFSSHDTETIAAFRNDVEAAEGPFRAAVREQVIAIRSQKGEVAGLEKLIRGFSTHSQAAPSKAQAFMAPYKRKLSMITDMKEKGVRFVSKASSSTASSFPSPAGRSLMSWHAGGSIWEVILAYCEQCGRNNWLEWNKNWKTFWHLHEQSRSGQDLKAHNSEPPVTGIDFLVQENRHGECTCKTTVSVRRDGSVVCEDTALLMSGDPHPYKPLKNLVYSSVKREVRIQAPNARIPLQTYCPGHHVQSPRMPSCSQHVIKDWACERCEGCLEYGKDGFLYCECGRVPLRACRFRCSSHTHGPLFVAFPADEDVERILETQEAPQQWNILLLGETGVGKSTFINAFANYVSFDSLESAIDSAEELVGLIPMAFTHTDRTTFETREIKFGQPDANEINHEGQSATQTCRSYTFPLSRHQSVHLIDTPGVGDTRGIEYDQANFENILSYLNHYTEIHGICVMLKPNTARLTVTFRFCIRELLRHLHKSASENIVFLFTNARSTFYTPGDTTVPLTKLLRDIQNAPPHVQIAYNARTVYCMDNEAFRYLLALREGCAFPPAVKASYSESWATSADVCLRMLEHFRSLEPHNVQETVSLNRAWSLVLKLQKPLEDVTNAIQCNLTKWDALKKELEEFQGDSGELMSIFMSDEVLNLQAVPFKKGARTVCNFPGKCCKRHQSINGEIEVLYTRVCHEPCRSSKVVRVLAQGNTLWFCKVMDVQGRCRVCQCHYKHHTRITYDAKLVPQKLTTPGIGTKLHSTSQKMEAKERKIAELKQRIEQWQQELDVITQACAKFALFFKSNSITPFNVDMQAYVHYQIEVERNRLDCNRALISRWEAFLEAYHKQITALERMVGMNIADHQARAHSSGGSSHRSSLRSSPRYGTAEEIMQLAATLFELKHHGSAIKGLVEEVIHCDYRTQFHNKTFQVRRHKKVTAMLKAHVLACSRESALQCLVPSRLTDESSLTAAQSTSNRSRSDGLELPTSANKSKSVLSASLEPYQGKVSSSESQIFQTRRPQSSSQVGSNSARSQAVSKPKSASAVFLGRGRDIDQPLLQEGTSLDSSARVFSGHAPRETLKASTLPPPPPPPPPLRSVLSESSEPYQGKVSSSESQIFQTRRPQFSSEVGSNTAKSQAVRPPRSAPAVFLGRGRDSDQPLQEGTSLDFSALVFSGHAPRETLKASPPPPPLPPPPRHPRHSR